MGDKRKGSGSENNPVAKRTKVNNSVRSLAEFRKLFPSISYLETDEEAFELSDWKIDAQEHREKIISLLSRFQSTLAMTISVASKKTRNERALLPFIYDLLKIAVSVRNSMSSLQPVSLTAAPININNTSEELVLDQAVSQVAEQEATIRQSLSSEDAALDAELDETGVNPSSSIENVEAEEEQLLGDIDPTQPADLKKIYIAIERTMKSEAMNSGYVELAIEGKDKKVKALVESKTSMFNVVDEIFQLCSYLAAAAEENDDGEKIFGIFTDYRSWKFARLEGDKMISSTEISLFLETDILGPGAIKIMMYMLEMLGVPSSTDVNATINASLANIDQVGAKLLSNLTA
jgi:hypothetical protein